MSLEKSNMVARSDAKVMNRFDLTKRLVRKLKNEEAVIGGIGSTNHDLWISGQRPQNFYMLGSMGLAVPIALGVALGQPRRKVFALEGDGSLLMQLGALGTVAAEMPTNLTIIVFDNGVYNITGGQATLTSHGVDLVAIARGAGLMNSEWAADESHFEQLVERALEGNSPYFIATRIDQQLAKAFSEFNPPKIRNTFMSGIGVA